VFEKKRQEQRSLLSLYLLLDFAEQKQAAGRKWHRGCLRCDGCSTALESGKLEEGPLSEAYANQTNIWCSTCYKKRFGPKGIGNAGMSFMN
jgi:hypothetical protein